MDPVPDSLLPRKYGSAGNLIQDLWICSQELWPLDQGGGPHFHIQTSGIYNLGINKSYVVLCLFKYLMSVG
jgi:hypothetical protein